MAARRSPLLRVETLESRAVPAVVVTQLDLDLDGAADDIQIVGDAGNNVITIGDEGNGAILRVFVDAKGDGDYGPGDNPGTEYTITGSTGMIAVNLGAGNDSFIYSILADLTAQGRTVSVNLGGGSNELTVLGGDHNLTAATRFDLDVAAGAGEDEIDVEFGQVKASAVSVRAGLGLGNDLCGLTFGLIDDGAAADVDVELGGGMNSFLLDLQGVGKFDRADMRVNVLGGGQADAATVNLHDDVGDGQARSSLLVNVDLLAGNDTFGAALDYNNFRVDDHSLASINARGGAGADLLVVGGTGQSGSVLLDPDSLLDINLQGGRGADFVSVLFSHANALELGGALRVRIDGGAGADALKCQLTNTAASTGRYDLAVRGRGSDDTAYVTLANPGTVTYGPLGKLLVDGGAGLDDLTYVAPAGSCAILGFEE